ncbi:MAG: serine/threonine-protein kinase [Gemmatimonadota bacterium]
MSEIPARLNEALTGRYSIERELGSGGMAMVFLADDLRHRRKVALKVLKPELAAAVGSERFLQEVTTTASLQHPHVLPLFDSGEAGGFLFYVMPYVQGESLREKLDREGQLGVEEAVGLVCDVAEALDYAHRHGVIHRDVKPENILLQDGRPLVAAFGVALAVRAAAGERLTETGLAVGTPRYMSPEQITGDQEVTGRADIYALGTVLYELLAGEPPHSGGSAQSIVAKILAEEPRPLEEVRRSVTQHVAAATAKALEKVPADRFQTAADFAAALRGKLLLSPPASSAATGTDGRGSSSRAWKQVTPWVLVVALAAAAGAPLLRSTPEGVATPVIRFTIPVPQGHELVSGWPNLAISPDGGAVVYAADDTLFKRALDSHRPEVLLALPGVCCPAFSPDGEWIFLGRGGVRPDAMGVSVDGGPLVDLSNQVAGYLGVHAMATGGGILIHRPGREGWEQLTVVDTLSNEGAHMWPQLLPGQNSVLFTLLGASLMWDGASIVVQDLDSGERRTVVEGGSYGRYVPTGHIVYVDRDRSRRAHSVLGGRGLHGRLGDRNPGLREGLEPREPPVDLGEPGRAGGRDRG